jgi:hypothetical protein
MGATIPKDRRTPPIVNEDSVHESTFKAWVGGKRKSVNPSGVRLDREGSTISTGKKFPDDISPPPPIV